MPDSRPHSVRRCARCDVTHIFGKPLSSRDRGNHCACDHFGPLFHTCGSCPHPPTQWPRHHRFLRRPSPCQCDSLLHLVARVVTLMGCASSKDEAPSPPRDGGGGGGGGGNSDTVRNSFMSNDSAGSPEILKEVAPHTPLPTHAPPYARPRTHAPPHPRPSLPSRFPPHAPAYPPPRTHAPLRHRGGGEEAVRKAKRRLHMRLHTRALRGRPSS